MATLQYSIRTIFFYSILVLDIPLPGLHLATTWAVWRLGHSPDTGKQFERGQLLLTPVQIPTSSFTPGDHMEVIEGAYFKPVSP